MRLSCNGSRFFPQTNSLLGLDQLNVSVDILITGQEFDHLFWAHALTDKKIGFIGDNTIMLELINIAKPHIMRWSKQIIQQLLEKQTLPTHLLETFPGLNKEQVITKLQRYTPHLIVHLGLQYETVQSSAIKLHSRN